MKRLILIKIQSLPYLVDTFKSYNIAYHVTDFNLSHPVGQLDQKCKAFIHSKKLMSLHQASRSLKIDSNNLKYIGAILGHKMNPYVIDLAEASNLIKNGGGEEEQDSSEMLEEMPEEYDDEGQVEEIFVKQLKANYEIVYDIRERREILVEEIQTSLQSLDFPSNDINALTDRYLDLTTKNIVQRSEHSVNEPIATSYLRNMFSEDMSSYHKSWLIPIVKDIKKVYYQDLFIGDQFSMALDDERKKETSIFSKFEGTEKSVMTDYVTSRHRYVPANLANAKKFAHTEPYLQDYTIHVVREATLSTGRFEVRKAYGSVSKLINVYEQYGRKRSPMGTEMYPVLDSELIEMSGFVRLPIELSNWKFMLHVDQAVTFFVPASLVHQWEKSKHLVKSYKTIDSLEKLFKKTTNRICVVIFPVSPSEEELYRIFEIFVPHLKNIARVHHNFIQQAFNLDQVETLLKHYDLSTLDLPYADYTEVTSILKDKVLQKKELFETRQEKLDHLLKSLGEIVLNRQLHLSYSEIIEDPLIIKYYGSYPDYQSVKDSQVNRLAWINRQLDGGQLYYLLANRNYLNLIVNMAKKETGLKNKLKQVTSTILHLSKELSDLSIQHQKSIQRAQQLDLLPLHEKTFIYVDQGRLSSTFDNVYVLNDAFYQPLVIYTEQQQINHNQIEQQYLEHLQNLVSNQAWSLTLDQQIKKSCINNQLLFNINRKINQRVPLSTKIDAKQLKVRDQTIEQLINRATSRDQSALNILKQLISDYGLLRNHSYIDKRTGNPICCEHLNITLYNESEDVFVETSEGNRVCRYCHIIFETLDFDDVEFDDFGVVTREASAINTLLAGHVTEISLADAMNCKRYKADTTKLYACRVISYLHQQGLSFARELNADQVVTAIDRYKQFLALSDVNHYAVTEIKNDRDADIIAKVSQNDDTKLVEHVIKSMLDRFILAIIALVSVSNRFTIEAVIGIISDLKIVSVINGGHLIDIESETEVQFLSFLIDQGEQPAIGDIMVSQYISETLKQYYDAIMKVPGFDVMTQNNRSNNLVMSSQSHELIEVAQVDLSFAPANGSEYYDFIDRIQQRLVYLNDLLLKKNNKLTLAVYNLIQKDSALSSMLIEQLPEPTCYKSAAELSDIVMNDRELVCSITLDLMIDYIIKAEPNPIQHQLLETPELTPVLTRKDNTYDLQHNQSLLTIIKDADVIALKNDLITLLDEIKELTYRTRQLNYRKRVMPTNQARKPTINTHDYYYSLVGNQSERVHVFPEEVETKPKINQAKIDHELDKDVKELHKKLQKCRKSSITLSQLQNLGSFTLSSQEHKDWIRNLKNKYNINWDEYVWVSVLDRELACFTHAQNDTLRSHLYLLHYMVACLKKNGYFLQKIKLDDTYKIILHNYQITLNNQEIDTLIGQAETSATQTIKTAFKNRLDVALAPFIKTINKDHTDTEKVSTHDINTYLHYHLIHELNSNWPKDVSLFKKYCEFVETFLKMIISHVTINDVTSQEIDWKLITFASHSKLRQAVSKDTVEAEIHREKKRIKLGGIRHEIPDEDTTRKQKEPDVYFTQDNTCAFGGEIDTDGIMEGYEDLLD